MSLQSERLENLLQRLGLTDMAQSYAALAEQAAQKHLSYCDFLEQVLESEAHARQERNVKVRTQLAGFPDIKRLEQFDFQFPATIDEKKIRELASLRFLERHENAVFLGPPGVGKTHLAVSLGMEAIRHGFSVYCVTLPDLLEKLVQAQAENRMRRKMVHLRKCRLLIRLRDLKAETVVITDRRNAAAANLAPRVISLPRRIPEMFTPIPYIIPAQIFSAALARPRPNAHQAAPNTITAAVSAIAFPFIASSCHGVEGPITRVGYSWRPKCSQAGTC